MNRLYRFESVRPLCNGIFEAWDPLSESRVWMLQWTPEPDAYESHQKAFEGPQQIDGVETLSDSVSFYLAADSVARARDTAVELMRQGLFSGAWQRPLDLPIYQPAEPPPPQGQPPTAGPWRTVAVGLLILCMASCIFAGFLFDDRWKLAARLESTVGLLTEDTTKLKAELLETRAGRDKSLRDLEDANAAHEGPEVLAAKTIADLYNSLPRRGTRTGLVQLTNSCSDGIWT